MLNVMSIIVSSRMAARCFAHPLEVIKIRMQLSDNETSPIQVVSNILKNEGILDMYSGLSASLMQEAAFTTTRIAIYMKMSTFVTNDIDPDENLVLYSLAGCISSFIWTPVEVVLVRMAADNSLPFAERRNYRNVFDALIRIIREEGFFTLWRGVIPTMSFSLKVLIYYTIFINSAKLIKGKPKGIFQKLILRFLVCHLYFHSFGLSTAAILMPFDFAKTKIQNMKTTQYWKKIRGKPEYSNVIDVWNSTVRNKGFLAVWKGFSPYYAHLVLYVVTLFLIRKTAFSYINQISTQAAKLFCGPWYRIQAPIFF